MGSLLRPAGNSWAISSSWQDHKNRKPPSQEPGTDYACPIGTVLVAGEAGTVEDVKTSNSGATGRYVTIRLANGWTIRYLHMSRTEVYVGQKLARGERVGLSGATANGSDYGVGAHVHATLWHSAAWATPTVDYEKDVGSGGSAAGGEDEDMALTEDEHTWLYWIFAAIRDGQEGRWHDGSVTKVIKHGDSVSSDGLKRLQKIQPMVEDIQTTVNALSVGGGGEIDYDALARALKDAGVTVVLVQPEGA